MSLFKFNLVFLLTFIITNTHSLAYTDNECLSSSYNVTIRHKGQPFGLAENILTIEKNICIIKVTHQQLKFLNKSWMIDVCREPVHIKGTKGAVEIIKKSNQCSSSAKDEFCGKLKTIQTIIQDDGLIFAQGDKEDIESDHGKVYCSYQLINSYLDRDFVFSSNKSYEDVLNSKKREMKVEIETNKVEVEAPRPVMEGQSSVEPAPGVQVEEVKEEKNQDEGKKDDPQTTTF